MIKLIWAVSITLGWIIGDICSAYFGLGSVDWLQTTVVWVVCLLACLTFPEKI